MSDINVIPYKNNTLSTSVFIQVPATVEDLVAQFGASAVWKACIRQVCYGPWNTTFRPLVAERLEKMFPEFPRKELSRRTNKAGEEVVSYESEQSYVTRLLADGGLEENVLATLAQEVANTVPFELVDSQTTKKPDAAYMAKARRERNHHRREVFRELCCVQSWIHYCFGRRLQRGGYRSCPGDQSAPIGIRHSVGPSRLTVKRVYLVSPLSESRIKFNILYSYVIHRHPKHY